MILPVSMALLVDAVIAFTVAECLLLLALHGLWQRGVAPRDFLLNMLSGVCLMLALRCAVRDSGAGWVALSLMAAGAAHGLDIWQRLRRAQRPCAVAQGAA